jgi:hypothetical protein
LTRVYADVLAERRRNERQLELPLPTKDARPARHVPVLATALELGMVVWLGEAKLGGGVRYVRGRVLALQPVLVGFDHGGYQRLAPFELVGLRRELTAAELEALPELDAELVEGGA